jgi:plastocyanin
MARRLLLPLTCALALAAVPAASPVSAMVTITATGFVPESVTINAGDSVTWRNADTTVHQVVFGQAPCNLTIQPGATASCTFRAGGSFNYRDPSQGGHFRGTVTVTGPVGCANPITPLVGTHGSVRRGVHGGGREPWRTC